MKLVFLLALRAGPSVFGQPGRRFPPSPLLLQLARFLEGVLLVRVAPGPLPRRHHRLLLDLYALRYQNPHGRYRSSWPQACILEERRLLDELALSDSLRPRSCREFVLPSCPAQ